MSARTLLRDDVYAAIRDAVVRGTLAPGEKISDAELGEWLGVSRTPVREALLRLSNEGLVESVPGRATRVTHDDPAVVQQARTVAAELHALAVRLAFDDLTDADLEQLDRANSTLRAAIAEKDATDALSADDAFHDVAVRAAGNLTLQSQLAQVSGMLRRAEHLHFGSFTGENSADVHDHIIAAIRARDVERAVALTRANWLGLAGA